MCQESVQTATAVDAGTELAQQQMPPQAEGFAEVNRSIPTPMLDNLHVKGSDLRWGIDVIFQGMSQDFAWDSSDDRGLFLSVRSVASKNLHFVSLGKLVCNKFLALSRTKLWWMNPTWGSRSDDVPPETQFLLLRLSQGDSEDEKYALILPIISGPFRSCIVSGNKGTVSLRVESGDSKVDSNFVRDIAFVAVGKNPYDLIHHSMAAASDRMKTFKLRKHKAFPASLDSFGWCTWDAFYSSVDGPGILQGVEALAAGGTPARTLIIDDGWQDTTFVEEEDHAHKVVDDLKAAKELQVVPQTKRQSVFSSILKYIFAWPVGILHNLGKSYYDAFVHKAKLGSVHFKIWSMLASTVLKAPLLNRKLQSKDDWVKRLRSAEAGERFVASLQDGSFKAFIDRLKEKNGIQIVYCWHALMGYWSGVHVGKPAVAGMDPNIRTPGPMSGILHVEPTLAWDALILNGVGLPHMDKVDDLYNSLHAYLKSSGVDGVKVDGQAALTMLGGGLGGSAATTRRFVQAMERSVVHHFGSDMNCINCMCHPTECLYSYNETSVARASDDFWPRDPASHTVHVANVAYNSLFIGEIAQPDWDMFQSKNEVATLHAVARSVGGCSVYVSDRPGEHDFDLLKRLVLPDGKILRALLPGRPTRDTIFADVTRDGVSPLKVWNWNSCNGVVAAFNLQGASWCRSVRKNVLHHGEVPTISTTFALRDLEEREGRESSSGRWSVLKTLWSRDGALKEHSVSIMDQTSSSSFSLASRECCIFTAAPLLEGYRQDKQFLFAALGLERMFNAGGAVLSVSMTQEEATKAAMASVSVRGSGPLLFHSTFAPSVSKVDGKEVEFDYDEETKLLRLQLDSSSADRLVNLMWA